MAHLRRETVGEQGHQQLRQRILGGELRPGHAVTEESMARDLGVSRPTMREILKSLVAEGLLMRHATTRVLQVTTLSDAEVREIYTARRLLELAGLDAAARADDEALRPLVDAVADMARAVAVSDTFGLVQADSRCHTVTVALLGSRYLTELHAQLMAKLHLVMSQVESAETREDAAVLSEHEEFRDLVLARRTAEAKAHLSRRLDEAEQLVLSRLQGDHALGANSHR